MVKNILIVDDELDDLSSMKKILEKENYKVETASSEGDVLGKIIEKIFDLIILDLIMPRSGYDLAKLLRRKLGHKSKIVYVSIVPKQEVTMAGADGFIQKPFSNEDFIIKVRSLLK